MSSGMPVLGIAQPDDDEARIIDTSDAGLYAEQGDVDGIVDAIDTWRTNPDRCEEQGKTARDAFEAHFTKDHSVDRYYRQLNGEEFAEDVTRGSTTREAE